MQEYTQINMVGSPDRNIPKPSGMEHFLGYATVGLILLAILSFPVPGVDFDEIGILPLLFFTGKAYFEMRSRREGSVHPASHLLTAAEQAHKTRRAQK